MSFTNRIVKYGLEPVDNVLFHPGNWRIHPTRQQEAVKGSLTTVGWVDPVIINLRTGDAWPAGERNVSTLVNGHMRVKLAAGAGETHVPVVYIDVDPEEEDFVLTTLDPLGALAVTDSAKLLELSAELNAQNETIKAALRGAGIDIRETFAHIAPAIAEQEPAMDGAPDAAKPRQEREPVIYTPTPGAQESKPADREKYPLAIVLDRRDYDRWLSWKAICNQNGDTAALRALLDNALDRDE